MGFNTTDIISHSFSGSGIQEWLSREVRAPVYHEVAVICRLTGEDSPPSSLSGLQRDPGSFPRGLGHQLPECAHKTAASHPREREIETTVEAVCSASSQGWSRGRTLEPCGGGLDTGGSPRSWEAVGPVEAGRHTCSERGFEGRNAVKSLGRESEV